MEHGSKESSPGVKINQLQQLKPKTGTANIKSPLIRKMVTSLFKLNNMVSMSMLQFWLNQKLTQLLQLKHTFKTLLHQRTQFIRLNSVKSSILMLRSTMLLSASSQRKIMNIIQSRKIIWVLSKLEPCGLKRQQLIN